jgi:hypothetical protein
MNAAGENVPAGKNIEKKVAWWWQGGRKTKMANRKSWHNLRNNDRIGENNRKCLLAFFKFI